MKKVTTTVTTYESTSELQQAEQAKALELMQHMQQLTMAKNAVEEALKADKERLEAIVKVVGEIENNLGTAKMTKAGTSKVVDYKGLKGFSEKIYKRFVTEKVRKGSLRVTFNKQVK